MRYNRVVSKEGYSEIETRIGLPDNADPEGIIVSLSDLTAENVSNVAHERTLRHYFFSEIINHNGRRKYAGIAVIEAPGKDGIVRYKTPLDQARHITNDLISASEEHEIHFPAHSTQERKQAINEALRGVGAISNTSVISPLFEKRRWTRIVELTNRTKFEIAGDRCEILKDQPIASNEIFAGNVLSQLEIEQRGRSANHTLLELREIVIKKIKEQRIVPTQNTPSKSKWLEKLLIDRGRLSTLPKRDKRAA